MKPDQGAIQGGRLSEAELPQEQAARQSTTEAVARNTFWYGLELGLGVLAALLTSIPVARVIGPEKLSYFIYLQWITGISGMLVMVGIPATTRKFVAEFLGRHDEKMAGNVFGSALRLQAFIALALAAGGTALALVAAQPGYKIIALLMVANVALKLIAYIPSAINNARVDMKSNFIGAVVNAIPSILLVNVSLIAGWGLVGVAVGLLSGTAVELVAKMWMTTRVLKPKLGEMPSELRGRMVRFSGQGLVLMLLNIVVWDRSDMVFLKLLDKDVRQISFFGLAFNLVDKILMVPNSFIGPVTNNIYLEQGRGSGRQYLATSLAARYALLISVPMMAGFAAISAPLVQLAYGAQYLPVIPVLAVSAMLALAKPLLVPIRNLLQAEDRQGTVIRWEGVCAALNIALDLTLIPLAGALGAALASGLAQAAAMIGLWVKGAKLFPVGVPAAFIARVLACSAGMAIPVAGISLLPLPAVARLSLGIPLGLVIYAVLVRQTRLLDENDLGRLRSLASKLPAPVGRTLMSLATSRGNA